MGPYHTQTEAQYSNFKAAIAATGILGMNADNCGQYGFVIPTDDPRPEITAAQKATKAGKPTENPDGSWSYKWTVMDKTAEELAQEETNRRQGMTAQRWSFATAVMGEGVITAEEAQAWGPGNALPATVDAALAAAISDPVLLAAARVRALAAPTINRLNPLVEILRDAFGLTPEKADELFQLARIIEES